MSAHTISDCMGSWHDSQSMFVCLYCNPIRLVESFKADAEAGSEELAKELRTLKRDKKALMSKLAGEGTAHASCEEI